MTDVTKAEARRHRQSATAVKASLRDLNIQLSLLNRQFGTKMALEDADWNCLDLINQLGPLSPGALARLAGMHPATMTGVLDRLQRGGFITRERDPAAADRRAVTVRATRDRNPELYPMLSGMNSRMDDLCDRYSEAELDLIADFLRRTAAAGHDAVAELADD
ncbi:MarR family transcriptional regulator [Nocardia sp. NPDC004604]|uniref:MarR family winged helix-turn-helix transcriptional regulator n=1 Tax=Nocardia sp. NPDC004604 TaxID=3157013 RepID=UPI0033A0995F